MSDYVIETWGLSKQYDGKGGCRDISLRVPRGIVFGFIGQNGAGKSTFVRTMLGLLQPTGGTAELLGRPIGNPEARRKVGYLPELFRFQDWLTGRQLLETHAELLGIPKQERAHQIDRLLDRVGLTGRDRGKIRGYSKGMQQRVGLACALLGDPELIFLDEPTSALDPIGRREVRQLMCELRDEGKTVFLNSHLLSEVENVCDHIAIIHKSELVVQGDWRQLAGDGRTVVELRADRLNTALLQSCHPLVSKVELLTRSTGPAQRWLLHLPSEESIPELVQVLSAQNVRVYELTLRNPSLEDLFLDWVDRKEQDHAHDRQTRL